MEKTEAEGSAICKVFRYIVFGVFVVCSAVIASVAVWNLGFVNSSSFEWRSSATSVDGYLIFLGACGLALIFPIIFMDLAAVNIVIGRVWFECVWVSLFGVMELAGAITLTAVSRAHQCDPTVRVSLASRCRSTQVLQGFTWICAIFLLSYAILLVYSALMHRKKDHTIWCCSTRKFPWLGIRHHNLPSAPTSPSLPRFIQRQSTPPVVAPKPRRAAPIHDVIYAYRSGLSLEYEIEHFQPPTSMPTPDPQNFSPAPAAAGRPMLLPLQTTDLSSGDNAFLAALYPQHVQSVLSGTQPPQPTQSHLIPHRRQQPVAQPSPLGDWPRMDATSRPSDRSKAKVKRKRPPSMELTQEVVEAASGDRNPTEPLIAGPSTVADQPVETLPRRPRPSGPRRRSNSSEINATTSLELAKVNLRQSRRLS